MAGKNNELKIVITGDTKKLQGALGEAEGSVGGFGSKFASMGPAVAAAGAVAVTAVAAVGVAAYKLGADFDDAYDNIRVGTGATGKTLDSLKDDFRAVVTSVPADFASASTAIADVNARLGLSGKPLQDYSTRILEMSRLTKSDLGASIETTTRMMGDWGIASGDQAKTLDKLFRASQATGVGVNDLASQVTSFGAPLRGLGFGLDESVALLGKWGKEGVNVENVLGAMKKGYGTFAKDFGEDAPKKFRGFIDELSKAPDSASAAALAIKTLGVRNGPDFAAAVQEGRFALGDLLDTVTNGKETILGAGKDTEDFSEKWQKFKNEAMVKLEPVVTKVFNAVGSFMDWVSSTGVPIAQEWGAKIKEFLLPIFKAMSDWWAANGPAIIGKVQELGAKVMPIIQGIGEIVQQVVTWISELWDRYGDLIMNRVKSVWNMISNVISAAMDIIKGVIDVIMGIIHGDWGRVWDGIKGIVSGAWSAIKAIVVGAWDAIKSIFVAAGRAISDVWSWLWGGITNAVTGAWSWMTGVVSRGFDSIVGFFRDLPGKIMGFAGTIVEGAKSIGSSIWRGIVDGISGAANFVGDLGKKIWNGIAGFINDKLISPIGRFKVSIPIIGELTPFSAINSLKIPKLAKGGIVTGPTLALLGDNRSGREAVVPLEKAGGMGFGGGGATYNITVNAGVGDPAEIGRQVVESIRRYESRNGSSWRAA